MGKENDYICDDREKEVPEWIQNLSKEELKKEFLERFGKYIDE